jgi:hypothetical protein
MPSDDPWTHAIRIAFVDHEKCGKNAGVPSNVLPRNLVCPFGKKKSGLFKSPVAVTRV